jgi:hypothetical protein
VATKPSSSGGSPFGCLAVIATLFVLWALVFGITVGGRKYEVGCSCDRGVVVE